MKIGIDGTPLAFPYHCGVKHYAQNLISALAKVDKKNEYILFVPKRVVMPPQNNFRQVLLPAFPPVFKRQLFLANLVKNEHIDVFHYLEPFGSMGFAHKKIVTTVHDLDLSRTYPIFKKVIYVVKRLYCEMTRFFVARHTKVFIAVSKTIMEELSTYLARIGANRKIVHIYEGAPYNFKGRIRFADGPKHFLCMGDFTPRKNIDRVFSAYASFIESTSGDYRLKLVTSLPEEAPHFMSQARRMGISRYLEVVIAADTDRLMKLYGSATAFLYPSLYEGFGLPILEAMACGCPVITSDMGAMKEIAGNSALLVNPSSVEEITYAMQRIINDKKLASKLRQRGLWRAKQFTWEHTARETIKIYTSIYG